MRARNRLLVEPEERRSAWLTPRPRPASAEHGEAIAAARAEMVTLLAQRLADQPAGPFAPGPDSGSRDGGPRAGGAGGRAQGPRRRAGCGGGARAGGAASSRPRRHPSRQEAAAERCSTGEQKALLLGMVLAHADLVAERAGRRPVMLLDEVAAPSRSRAAGGAVRPAGRRPADRWMTRAPRRRSSPASASTPRGFLSATAPVVSGYRKGRASSWRERPFSWIQGRRWQLIGAACGPSRRQGRSRKSSTPSSPVRERIEAAPPGTTIWPTSAEPADCRSRSRPVRCRRDRGDTPTPMLAVPLSVTRPRNSMPVPTFTTVPSSDPSAPEGGDAGTADRIEKAGVEGPPPNWSVLNGTATGQVEGSASLGQLRARWDWSRHW